MKNDGKGCFKKTNEIFFHTVFEDHYTEIPRKVITEELVEGPSGDLMGKEIFGYRGRPAYIQIDLDRFTNLHANFR